MFNLKDKVILVVGGRGFLGRDFCEKLRSQNATVISADLNNESKAASKENFVSTFDDIIQVNVDVTSENSVKEMVANILSDFKTIDVLVFCATSKPHDFYAPFTECSLDGWQSVLRTELDGIFLVSQQVGKAMELQEYGNIIYISSMYGVVGNDQRIYKGSNLANLYVDSSEEAQNRQIYSHSVYPTVKGGVISLTRYLAAYWGNKNIRVNCVSPGGVKHKGENEEFVKKYSEKVPLGRKAEVSEVASAVVFLASDDSSYITGQNIIIDGGWTAW